MELNVDILRAFGAKIGKESVLIYSPVTLHIRKKGYVNLTIGNGCVLNGNNYLDLAARITLEEGVSLGPGVIISTHNRFNYNKFLEERLSHLCGEKDVLIKKGAAIKAGALIVMGITIGENAVVAGGTLVNRDIPPNRMLSGESAKEWNI